MSKINNIVGKVKISSELGKILVLSRKPKTRTILIVQVLDRGKGWNEQKQTYRGYKNSVGWMRGENREYNTIDEIHINTLT